MKREFKTIVIIFMFIFLFELFYSVFLYKHFTFYIFSFTLLYSLIIYLLYKIFNKKWIIYICFSIILLMFLSNFVYYSVYNNTKILNKILTKSCSRTIAFVIEKLMIILILDFKNYKLIKQIGILWAQNSKKLKNI